MSHYFTWDAPISGSVYSKTGTLIKEFSLPVTMLASGEVWPGNTGDPNFPTELDRMRVSFGGDYKKVTIDSEGYIYFYEFDTNFISMKQNQFLTPEINSG